MGASVLVGETIMRTRGVLAALLVAGLGLSLAAQAPKVEAVKESPRPDPWVGEYFVQGDWMKGHLVIQKEGNVYTLSQKPYDMHQFREVRPGVLEARNLGRIYRGTLQFEDARPAVPVLRYEFCYEHGYLIGQPLPVGKQ
jgi:hypothetical protein